MTNKFSKQKTKYISSSITNLSFCDLKAKTFVQKMYFPQIFLVNRGLLSLVVVTLLKSITERERERRKKATESPIVD